MKQLASLLSVWSLCCCLQENLIESFILKCTSGQMTVKWLNGTFKECLNCADCHPGHGLYPHRCGGTVTFPAIIECKKCEIGKTFSDTYDTSSCEFCHLCAEHEVVTQKCTLSSDTKCNKTCNSGYFFSKLQQDCKRCSYCCLDGKDEEQPQCINEELKAANRYCSPRPDRTCNPRIPVTSESKSSPNNTKPTSQQNGKIEWPILLCVGIGLLLGLIIFFCCLWRKTRNRGNRQHYTVQTESNLREDRHTLTPQAPASQEVQRNYANQSDASTPQAQHKGIPHTALTIVQVPGLKGEQQNYVYQSAASTPQGHHKGIPHTALTILQVPGGLQGEQQNYAYQSAASTPQGHHKGIPHTELAILQVPRLQGEQQNYAYQSAASTPQVHHKGISREYTDESARLGMHDNKDVMADNFAGKAHESARVNTRDKDVEGQSWPPEEVNITSFPDSPKNSQAGSRMEFHCTVRGCQQVLYRWFKDGQELTGEDNSTLVLDPLQVRHFGFYYCEVRSDKSHDSSSKDSKVVELDVTPVGGKSYRKLSEVFNSDMNLKETVANLLEKKTTAGRKAYKHVAFHYKMKGIDHLEQKTSPGEDVLVYLETALPDLTVYHFCKVLKGENIRRLDIVNKLVDYLIG